MSRIELSWGCQCCELSFSLVWMLCCCTVRELHWRWLVRIREAVYLCYAAVSLFPLGSAFALIFTVSRMIARRSTIMRWPIMSTSAWLELWMSWRKGIMQNSNLPSRRKAMEICQARHSVNSLVWTDQTIVLIALSLTTNWVAAMTAMMNTIAYSTKVQKWRQYEQSVCMSFEKGSASMRRI